MEHEHKGVNIEIYMHGQCVLSVDSYTLHHMLKYSNEPNRREFTAPEFYLKFEPSTVTIDDNTEDY